MKKWLRSIVDSLRGPEGLMLLLFGIEGIFLQFDTSINTFGNNLYATNLGAADSQIGLIQLIPNLVACAALLPLGILSDRMKSSKTVPLATLLVMAAGYFGFATVPIMGEMRMTMFFIFLAFTAGGLAIYNAQWQAFFGDVTRVEQRNGVFAFRNKFMFVIGIIAPVICGVLMGFCPDSSGKLLVLRAFFYIAGACTLLQAYTIARIPGGRRSPEALAELAKNRFSARDVAVAVGDVARSRDFLWFFLPMLFFYLGWHLDWSMWYIGEVQYCSMTETDLSIYSGVFNIGQLLTIGLMAKLVRRKSPDFTVMLGIGGLVLCSCVMMAVPPMPEAIRPAMFTLLVTVVNAPQCAINLCVVQMLLKSCPERNRSLIISLYTMVITLSNSIMPWLGVEIYTWLGSDMRAFYLFNSLVAAWRGAALIVFIWRYKMLPQKSADF